MESNGITFDEEGRARLLSDRAEGKIILRFGDGMAQEDAPLTAAQQLIILEVAARYAPHTIGGFDEMVKDKTVYNRQPPPPLKSNATAQDWHNTIETMRQIIVLLQLRMLDIETRQLNAIKSTAEFNAIQTQLIAELYTTLQSWLPVEYTEAHSIVEVVRKLEETVTKQAEQIAKLTGGTGREEPPADGLSMTTPPFMR